MEKQQQVFCWAESHHGIIAFSCDCFARTEWGESLHSVVTLSRDFVLYDEGLLHTTRTWPSIVQAIGAVGSLLQVAVAGERLDGVAAWRADLLAKGLLSTLALTSAFGA